MIESFDVVVFPGISQCRYVLVFAVDLGSGIRRSAL
jgi:hypothetical protein